MYRVRKNSSEPGLFPSIKDALVKWAEDAAAHTVIEIVDSEVYDEKVSIQFGPGRHSLQLRAASNVRPHISLVAYETGRSDSLKIRGQSGNRFTLDGLLISGRGMTVEGDISRLVIRHATMVPGWSLESVHKLQSHARPSLTVQSPQACVIIEHSILGTIQVSPMPPKVPEANGREEDDAKQQMTDEEAALARCRGMGRNVRLDPISVCVSDSILDATDTDLEAIGAPGCPVAHAVLVMRRCTVLGQVQVHAIELAENSIFNGRVTVARRQRGCMRFCFVEPGSRTPKWYRCQPELAEQLAADEICAQLKNASADEIDAALEAAQQQASSRVRPLFNSVRYGTPTYCQLAQACAEEITRGADDESEMGVFHDLYQPQRTSNLRARLEEYTPAGMDAGILFAS